MGEERGEEMGEMVDLDILSSIQECFQVGCLLGFFFFF